MSTNQEAEKAYYEERYAPFLGLPEADLRFTAAGFLADLDNPAREVFERRRLYRATLSALGRLSLSGKHVLDYGCGTGDFGLWMVTAEGARVTFLDLSENAIRVCLLRARASGVAAQCEGVARDASDLSCFPDATFSLVYGCASLHHTIKYAGAWDELLRVLEPGGDLVLTETFGNNSLLNALRRWNWRRGGLSDDQGEDIIFSNEHLAILRECFREVHVFPMGLLSMAKRAMRRRFGSRTLRAVLSALEAADALLLSILPPLKSQCGEVLVVARGRR